MKRMLLFAGLIAVTSFLGLMPFEGTDVGKLHPVEVMVVSCVEELIVFETDTGVRGIGKTVDEAIEDLKCASTGMIFLDTVNYVLVHNDVEYMIDLLYGHLRPACQVYTFAGDGKWRNLARYLESHPSNVTLLEHRQGMRDVPGLVIRGEDYIIDKA